MAVIKSARHTSSWANFCLDDASVPEVSNERIQQERKAARKDLF